jgi:hypothetical protein
MVRCERATDACKDFATIGQLWQGYAVDSSLESAAANGLLRSSKNLKSLYKMAQSRS